MQCPAPTIYILVLLLQLLCVVSKLVFKNSVTQQCMRKMTARKALWVAAHFW